jgi:hypothetical protein
VPLVHGFSANRKVLIVFVRFIAKCNPFQIAFTEHVLSANQETMLLKKAKNRSLQIDSSGRIPFVYINTDWSNANKNTAFLSPSSW